MGIKKTIKDREASMSTEMSRYDTPLENPRIRIVVTVSSVLAYILLFTFLHYTYGQAMAISATIPVIVVGWVYGFMWGISTALLSLVANILMYKLFGVNWFEGMISSPGGIPGTLALISIGAIVGHIRDLSMRLKKELLERKQVEKELQKHREELDELVKQRTDELQKSNINLGKEINQRKLADAKLQETKDHLENIISSSLDCIMVSDKTGYITDVNKYFLELFGYRKEEVLGKHMMELTPMNKEGTYESTTGGLIQVGKEYNNNANAMVSKFLEESHVTNWEDYYFNKNGKLVPVEQNIVCLYNNASERIGAVAIVRDITEKKRNEQQLRKTKDNLNNILESSLDGIVVSDSTGNIVKANKSFSDLIGYQIENILGKHIMELSITEPGIYESTTGDMIEINEDFFNETREIIYEKLLKEGALSNWESYYLNKDGKIVPVEQNISYLFDEEGNIIGSVGINRDITERQLIEKEIRTSRDFLMSVIEGSRDGIVIVDEKGYITSTNTAIEKMCKFSKEELIGKHASELTVDDRDIRKKILKRTEELYERGYVFCESKHATKDRNIIDVEYSLSMIKNDKGDYIAGVAIIRDITERKHAEEALRESEEKYFSLIEHANDAVISMNNEGMIVAFNKKSQELYGYTQKEILGRSVLLLVPPPQREQQKKSIERLKAIDASKMQGRTVETKGFRKDGSEFPAEVSIFGLETKEESIFTSFIRDITERKKMEQQLLQSEKLKSLGELAGGVAHDFNNVLAAILGRAQLLKMQFTPPPGKHEIRKSMLDLMKSLEIIERASSDGAETVRRIQEFSRKRSDDRDFTQVTINELLDNALEFTRVRWKNDAESKGIKIRIKKELSTLIPILGSPSELREVFTNLINNALDAMPEGGEIRVKSFMEDTIAVVKIGDTGSGIPKNIIDRIFDPFFTTKGVKSTGLGLSVTYGIINRHHGTITADSVEGKGATFTLKFPVIKKKEKGEVKKEKVIPIKRKEKKARILLIEDEEDVRELLRDILAGAGHEVELAKNGSEGITLFKEKEFDLVFTDLGMPVMSGWEVAEKVKSINVNVPVALITGWNVALEESRMNDSGVNLVIHKPFEIEQVLNLVREGMILRDQLKAV
jgi:PAS domain S-box-containing protein